MKKLFNIFSHDEKCKFKRYHYTPETGGLNISGNIKCRQGCRETGLLIITHENVKWYSHSGKQLGRFLNCKTKHASTSVVWSLSRIWLFVTPWTVDHQAGSSVHGISQVWILEWIAIPFPKGSSRPRDQTHISCVYCMCLLHWQVDSLPLAPPDPAITLLDLNPRDENSCLHKNMYTIVHSSFIYNSQKLKTATMSFNRMIKQTLIYPYREILVCIKKEWIINICNNLDGSLGHQAE